MDIGAVLLMAGAGAAVIVSAVLGLGVYKHDHPGPPIEWPPSWEQILEEKAEAALQLHVEQRASHKHNIHCAKCGRFAKVVQGMPGAGDCKYHGLTIRVRYAPGALSQVSLM